MSSELPELALEWVRHADADLDTAHFLNDEKRPIPLEIVCFHCQQSGGKYLKAYLAHNDAAIPSGQRG